MGSRISVPVIFLSAVAGLGATSAWAQQDAASGSTASFDAPRTPWGDPDLQGVWDYRTITPMQRPAEFGDREFYTEEEVAALEGRAARRMDEPPDEDTPANLVHAQYMTDPGRHVDESHRTSLIVDPPNGRVPPLTPEAEAMQAAARNMPRSGGGADSYVDRTLMERCITQGFPRSITPTLYNNNIEIVQAPGHVAIIHEMIHETRVIPLDGSDFTGVRSYIGESRGHWEGDTLVVETRNFNGEVSFQGARENLTVTERFTRVAPDRIGFSMTLEDDSHWTQPWTIAYTMRPTDGKLFEYACHEGNYGLRNILQNARDAERAEAN
jgi:hypothetical protein